MLKSKARPSPQYLASSIPQFVVIIANVAAAAFPHTTKKEKLFNILFTLFTSLFFFYFFLSNVKKRFPTWMMMSDERLLLVLDSYYLGECKNCFLSSPIFVSWWLLELSSVFSPFSSFFAFCFSTLVERHFLTVEKKDENTEKEWVSAED